MARYWRGLLSLLILLTACNSSPNKPDNKVSSLDSKAAFEQFSKNFKTVTLPFLVPGPDTSGKKAEISRELIASLFTQRSFKPAFDEKDVPDLAENMQSSNFFYEAMWQTDGYQAFVVSKSDEDNYWYLATFDKEGIFIDGMCIAFQIGDDEIGKAQRTSQIGDDQSVMIRQSEGGGEKNGSEDQTRFYEIATDGRIVPLKDLTPVVKQPV
jgi:hypothetical protein